MKPSTLRRLLSLPARLPLGALYGISGAIAPVLHHLVRYRRRVVRENIDRCFPEKTPAEKRDIEKKFYRNFADNVVETLKLLDISDKEMADRMEFEGTEILDDLMARGKSIAVYFSHTFNWEWAPSVSLHTVEKPSDRHVFAQIYRPLRSKSFDALMLDMRHRFGSESIPKATALRRLLTLRRKGVPSITGFMSDQHPSHGDPGHLTTLLGRPTLMISGTETLARKLGMAAVYWDIEKTSRGHYRITTRLIADDVASTAPGEVTERYTRLLEATIRRQPELWLWSHNRWKHPVTLPEKENGTD